MKIEDMFRDMNTVHNYQFEDFTEKIAIREFLEGKGYPLIEKNKNMIQDRLKPFMDKLIKECSSITNEIDKNNAAVIHELLHVVIMQLLIAQELIIDEVKAVNK